jgi:hypothetical protein
MVSEKVKVGLISEVSSGASGLGLLVMSHLFELARKTRIISQVSASQVRGLAIGVAHIPHLNYPLLAICFFPMQNQKMVIAQLTNFPLHLGRTIKVNRLNLKRHYWPFILHVMIDFY